MREALTDAEVEALAREEEEGEGEEEVEALAREEEGGEGEEERGGAGTAEALAETGHTEADADGEGIAGAEAEGM